MKNKDLTQMHILIADDHSFIRRGIINILLDECPNCVIEEAEDGKVLLNMVRENAYDLVISDITMPGLDGLEALKQLKSEFPKLPVLMMSMHSEDQYAIRVLRAGAAGFFSKTSAPNELVVAIRKIQSGKRYISPSVAEKLAETIDANSSSVLGHEDLSDREFEVFKFISEGKTVSEIGEKLSLSVNTISTYRKRILEKLFVSNNAEIMRYAVVNNLI